MSPQLKSIIISLILAFATYCQGLQFSIDTTPDGVNCGHLHCLADKSFPGTNIASIVNLGVYDVTESDMPVKLASLSVFDPDIYIHKTETNVVNVTGTISSYQAELTVGLRDHNYCLNGSFLCQLDFVNTSSLPDVIRQTVSLGSSGNCNGIEKELAKVNKEVTEVRQENVILKTELSKVQEILNSSRDTTQEKCFRGMPHKNSRDIFLLMDRTAALCDTETDGGGWIVIQRRTKGDVDFYRNWNDYKIGFGNPETDFWIGNDIIHNLTSKAYTELRIDMVRNGTQIFAQYSHFDVANETSLYLMSVSGYNGTAWDNLSYHNGMAFTTFDKDNDNSTVQCAVREHGAWWYNACYGSNLNGIWGAQNNTGAQWSGLVSLSEMKIRHV